MIKPPALKPGGTIGIMAPSSRVERGSVEKACQWLDNYGFRLKIHPQTYLADHQSAGTPQQKLDAFHELINDPSVDAIMAARGGNRAGLMLFGLDYALLARKPKILIGYSDLTVLLNGIQRKTGMVTFHGPGLNSFLNGTEEKHLEHAFLVMAGMTTDIPMWGTSVFRTGDAEGRLAGGNLSVLCSLMGTVWEPDFNNAILFLEDTGDQLSRYDRMLTQLRNAGVFDKVKGVIFGDIAIAEDKSAVPFGYTLNDIISELLNDLTCPVVTKAPFGHGINQVTMPIGATVRLEAKGDRSVTLHLTESPVYKF